MHILEELVKAKFNVVAAATEVQVGRVVPPIKVLCEKLKIPCLQFKSVGKEGEETLRKLRPDIFVVASYGQLFTQNILDIVPVTLNVHPSLLPLYRGATPIQAAILNGETKTGVSIQKMVKKLDAGDIIVQTKFELGEDETAGEAYVKASKVGAESLIKALRLIQGGEAVWKPQDDTKVTICRMIKKEHGVIDFNKSATELVNFVRGYNPWPVAHAFYKGKLIKVFRAKKADMEGLAPGQIRATKNRIFTGCKDNESIELLELQAEGGKKMSAAAFLCGNKLEGSFDERS